jgi:flagellar protein FliS
MNMNALATYRSTQAHSGIEGASPHKLISMLLDGALDRLKSAKGHMARGERAPQGESIGKVIDIVASLDAYLDVDKGGEVAINLASLYDYMVRKLFEANRDSSVEKLLEIEKLLLEIRAGWVGISAEADD